MESASCELALKPSLYNNRPIHSKYFRPGNTRLPRTSSLARGNTHFPRTWCLAREKHPHSAHLSLARSQHSRQPQGFGSPPINRHGLRKLPTQQSMSYRFILCTQLGRVSPYGYEVPPPYSGLQQMWYESCRNRLTITLYQQLDEYTVISVSDRFPSFQNNTIFI